MTSNDAERADDQPRPSGAFAVAPDADSVFPARPVASPEQPARAAESGAAPEAYAGPAREGNAGGEDGSPSTPAQPAVPAASPGSKASTPGSLNSGFPATGAPAAGVPSSARAEPPVANLSTAVDRRWALVREVGIIVVAALIISFLIKTFLVQPFVIPSESMEDTLIKDDRVLASRLVPRVLDVHRGDVVVFKDPGGWLANQPQNESTGLVKAGETVLTFVGIRPVDAGEHLIKRVIGLPGDRVACCDAQGRVTVNGVPIDETYLKPGVAPSMVPFDKVVPEGHLFVLGDNRSNSGDSRFNTDKPGGGFVPLDNVVGTAVAKVWPLDRVALMRNPGSVFEDVPEP